MVEPVEVVWLLFYVMVFDKIINMLYVQIRTSLVFTIDVSDGSYSIYTDTVFFGIVLIAFPQM